MNPLEPRCPPVLRLYQTFMEQDRRLRLENQARLRELAREFSDQVRVFCAHDTVQLEAFQREPMSPPQRPKLRPVPQYKN